MSDTLYMDVRELADEWEEATDELALEESDRMLDDDTREDLRETDRKFRELCDELGLTPNNEPSTLRWYADHVGGPIIRADTFEDYARDYAEEIGAISETWPSNHVNWARAADELRQDWYEFSWDGHEWLRRA